MASYEREEEFVRRLLSWLDMNTASTENPNADGKETGADVLVRLTDHRTIGIQVTEIDPYPTSGVARAEEKRLAKEAGIGIYSAYAQNDPSIVMNSIIRSITRKVEIASKHQNEKRDEFWLLLCGGIPEMGALVSTFVMPSLISAEALNAATDSLLKESKYDQCFFLQIVSTEQALYKWRRNTGWEKFIRKEYDNEIPRDEYVNSLMQAADSEERRRLCNEEAMRVLREVRQNKEG